MAAWALLGQARALEVRGRDEDASAWKPASARRRLRSVFHEQQRAHHEHQRERHLRDDEHAAQAEALAASGKPPPARLHGRARSDVSGAQGGSEPKSTEVRRARPA
jgi:hypothetical protein